MLSLSSSSASLSISQYFLTHLLNKVQEIVAMNQFVGQNMSSFSSNRMMRLANEINDQMSVKPNLSFVIHNENEPHKIKEDQFMPVSKIEQKRVIQQTLQNKCQNENEISNNGRIFDNKALNHPRNSLNKQENVSTSIQTNDRKLGSQSMKTESKIQTAKIIQEKGQKLMKLDEKVGNDEKEDKIITKMRKRKQEIQKEEKLLQIYKNNNVSKYSKVRKEKFGFDYEGKIIDIRLEAKNNIITKVVQSEVRAEMQRKRESNKHHKSAVHVQTKQIQSQQQINERKRFEQHMIRKSKNLQDCDQKIQFSGIKDPLNNINVKRGVKVTFGDHTLQNAQQDELDDEQIRNSMVNRSRKMSKNQYKRLKTASSLRYAKNKSELSYKLQFSEADNIISLSKKDIINVEDENQKSKQRGKLKRSKTELSDQQKDLIEARGPKNIEQQQGMQKLDIQKNISNKNRPASEMKKKYSLNRIDRYNLDYSRGWMKLQTSHRLNKVAESDSSTFIQSRLDYHKPHSNFPKLRERVKDISLLRRSNMKKFQESLRI